MKERLKQNREKIVKLWVEAIVSTYPQETSRFLLSNKDRFTNPVGSSIKDAAAGVFEFLIQEKSLEEITPFVDSLIRIRAVQDFTPSEAMGAFFTLKKCLHKALGELPAEELIRLDSMIDGLSLLAFDIYMKCREKVWEIKYNEFMNRPSIFFEGPVCPSYALRKKLTGKGADDNDDESQTLT